MSNPNEFVYAPGPRSDFVELSRTTQGKLFRKHILSKGVLHYPGVTGGKVDVDDALMDSLITNFNDHVCDIVQVPVADSANEHSEDPDRNIGEVVDLRKEGDKLYAYFDARDEEKAKKLGKTYLGASALMSLNYTDTRDGQKKGPTLLHVAVTNRPHIVDLEDYEELLAASAEGIKDAVVLTASATPKEKVPMTDLDDLLAALKDEHDIDVPALQAKAAEKTEPALALSAELQAEIEKSGLLKLTNGQAKDEDVLTAVVGIAEKSIALSAQVAEIQKTSAEDKARARVEKLVSDGFITPAKQEAYQALLLTNPEQFEAILPEKPLVALSAELGNQPKDTEHDSVVENEIVRLSNAANGVAAA